MGRGRKPIEPVRVTFRGGHPVEKTGIPDGVYLSVSKFATDHDISYDLVWSWIRRKQIPFIDYYGRTLIPEKCSFVELRRGKKAL